VKLLIFEPPLLPEQINQTEEEQPAVEPDVIPDVTLKVEGESFYVNRGRLALQSPYFRALFFGCGVESSRRRIEIKGVNVEHFRVLMEHSRTCNLALDRNNVLEILRTADYLQLEGARLLCSKFLERELHLSNCVGMMAFAWQLGCSQLYTAARQVVLTHFSAVYTQEDFLSLSKESIADLLASDDLTIMKDDLALEAVLCWVAFDPKREEHFLELIELVRPESLSLPFLTELLTRMKSSDPRAQLICKLNQHFPASWSMGRSVRRTRAGETLFVLGGPHDQEQQPLYRFHPLSGRWQKCSPLQRKNLTQYSVAAAGKVAPGGGQELTLQLSSFTGTKKYCFLV
uniref:BTB domain-containing protein n=1 Tax=Amphiprion percula TaxID=161767 RepID=A0A3P8UFQ6_AMPPE